MKLIYTTNARIPTEKAHGLQIVKMCEAFSALGFEVELIVPKRKNPIKENIFEYYGIKKPFTVKIIFCLDLFGIKLFPNWFNFYIQSFSFSVLALVYALLKYQRKKDIFYSRDYFTLFLLCLFGFSPVAEIHDYNSEKPKQWIGYVMKKVKKIIANSKGTKKFLQEHYHISDNKFLVAPNGVDIDFFNIKETKEEARKKLNLPQDKIIISYIGRLETKGIEKGVPDLIRAFTKLEKIRANIFLLIIGGPQHLMDKYKKIASQEGIPENKIIFTGQIKYSAVPRYLRAIDIVVIPFPATKQFSFTTSPIKVLEFMAAEKTIIASDLPALYNILNEKNCVFFTPGDFLDLAKKLGILLANQEISRNLSRQAFLEAQKYTWEKRAEKIINFIK